MNLIVKKLLKILLVLITSTVILYLSSTITAFYTWCTENQISMLVNSDELLLHLDNKKIQELGDTIGDFAKLMENSLDESYYEGDSDHHSLAENFDPLGFSVWAYMQEGIRNILTRYINISILSGIAITIAYVIITCKRMNNILKFALGYFGVILIFPQILWYSYYYRFFSIFQAYYSTPNIKYFYIGYTTIFLLIYIINYKVGVRMTKELNQTIKK